MNIKTEEDTRQNLAKFRKGLVVLKQGNESLVGARHVLNRVLMG